MVEQLGAYSLPSGVWEHSDHQFRRARSHQARHLLFFSEYTNPGGPKRMLILWMQGEDAQVRLASPLPNMGLQLRMRFRHFKGGFTLVLQMGGIKEHLPKKWLVVLPQWPDERLHVVSVLLFLLQRIFAL